ncbi:MAG: DEAD/DEAH box helicase [Bdellovibrionota bacterium]
MNSFSDFGLLASLQKTLAEKSLTKPTEIQAGVVPKLLNGDSVVGISETGSGKTLAYALPLLHLLKALEKQGDGVTEEATPRAIVMVPTRELGEQISKVFKTLTHDTRLRVRPALGGMALEQSRRNVSGAFEILLATPGRLVQLMELGLIHLTDVRMVILDEADQMLDQGFLRDTNLIVAACPSDVQLGLFSATVPPPVQELMSSLFVDAEVVKSAGSGKVVKTLVTKNLIVEDGKRWPLFEKILDQKAEGGTLVFTNTRDQCDKLAKELLEKGYACAIYRGDMEKNTRRTNLKKFRDGAVEILVSTDLAGRGLDIENVGRVINFHLPQQMENYLHRVGRTARAGRKGTVFNLVTERDQPLIDKLEGRKPAAKPALKADPRESVKSPAQKTGKAGQKHAGKAAGKAGNKTAPKTKATFESKRPTRSKQVSRQKH